jgi:hypothetical protein
MRTNAAPVRRTSTRLPTSVAAALSLGALAACNGTVDGGLAPGANGARAGASAAPNSAGSSALGSGATFGAGGAPVSSGGAPGAAGAAAGAPSGTAVPIPVTGTPVPESAGTLVMRRLSYREYDHMLAVLLGDTTAPASGANPWSPDAPAATGFIAPSSVASYHVVQFNQAADALVDTAVAALASGGNTGKFVLPAGCSAPAAADESSCATSFITAFGLHAYRRPVTSDEQTDLLSLFTTVRTDDAFSFTEAIGAIAKAMLQSPNFLYHWELGADTPVVGSDGLVALTPWQVAARLANALWESMPDDALFDAAQNGQLSTPEQVTAQAERMLADPQAAQSLYSFHVQWLFDIGFHVTDLGNVAAKPNSLLTDGAAQGLETEFTQFVSSVYAPPGDGTLSTLYTAPYAFVNKDLAAIYGVAGPASGFAKVNLDPTERAGIFTQVAFLAGIEDTIADNPVYRGLAIYTKVLCGTMQPPPANVPGVNFVSGGTTRQAYDAHGSSACAIGCHGLFDPPGFAFENYDGVGQYRTMEAGQNVDASGTFPSPLSSAGTPGGSTFQFQNAVELVNALAGSPEAQVCLDRQWTRYMAGRMETMADTGSIQTAFGAGAATQGFSLRTMVETLLSSKAFLFRTPSDGEPL